MALGKQEVLDAVAGMTVLDLSELIKMMEEKFGVSAAAAVRSTVPASASASSARPHRLRMYSASTEGAVLSRYGIRCPGWRGFSTTPASISDRWM